MTNESVTFHAEQQVYSRRGEEDVEIDDFESVLDSHKKSDIPPLIVFLKMEPAPAPRQEQVPRPGGRPSGARGFSTDELKNLLKLMEEHLPIGNDEWNRMAEAHASQYPGRDATAIRRKYNTLHRRRAPTGDPNIPWEVKWAKLIKQQIAEKAEISLCEEDYDLADGYEPPNFTNVPPTTEELIRNAQEEFGRFTRSFKPPPSASKPPAEVRPRAPSIASASSYSTPVSRVSRGLDSLSTAAEIEARALSAVSVAPVAKRSYGQRRAKEKEQDGTTKTLEAMKAVFAEQNKATAAMVAQSLQAVLGTVEKLSANFLALQENRSSNDSGSHSGSPRSGSPNKKRKKRKTSDGSD